MFVVNDTGVPALDAFRADFPDRFLNAGLAEQSMIGIAAGLAKDGFTVFVYGIVPFVTMRCFEQIQNDVCLARLNVRLVGIGGGLCYSGLGPTHHAITDIAVMRALPNMTICAPCDPREARKIAQASLEHDGPLYIRLAKIGEPALYKNDYSFEIGTPVVMRYGTGLGGGALLIASGPILSAVLQVAEELEQEYNTPITVLNVHTIKPMTQWIRPFRYVNAIVVVEEHSVIGGLGSAVAEFIAEQSDAFHAKVQFARIGIPDVFCQGYGSREELLAQHGVSKEHVKEAAKKLLAR